MDEVREVPRGKLLGIKEINELVGDVPPNYVILLKGPPGTGKTSFALATVFRNVVERGSKAVYVILNEDARKLVEVSRSIGYDLDSLSNSVDIVECPTVSDEYLVDMITEEISKRILNGYDLVVIDSVTPILKVLGTYAKKRAWLHTVVYKIASAQNVMVILIADTLLKDDPDMSLLEYLADVVIELNFKPESIFPRWLRIRKFRTRPALPMPIYFTLSSDGVKPINLVSKELVRKVRRRRKEIIIESPIVKKLLGPSLKPGTQIGIVIKEPATGLGYFHQYLVLKFTIEALTRGVKVGVAYYGATHKHVLKEEEIVKNLLKDNFTLVQMDSTGRQIPHHLVKNIKKPEDIDVLIVTGYEKLTEFYGIDEVNKMIATYHETDSRLGVITFRVYRVSPHSPQAPSCIYSMSDIVLEVTLNEERGCFNIRVIKGAHARRPITILDTELEPAVLELRRKLEELVGVQVLP